MSKATQFTITKFHTISSAQIADLIGELDLRTKAIEAQIAELKAELKQRGDIVATGEHFTVSRTDAVRIALDTTAIRKSMGDVWCDTFSKLSQVTSFRIKPSLMALAA